MTLDEFRKRAALPEPMQDASIDAWRVMDAFEAVKILPGADRAIAIALTRAWATVYSGKIDAKRDWVGESANAAGFDAHLTMEIFEVFTRLAGVDRRTAAELTEIWASLYTRRRVNG